MCADSISSITDRCTKTRAICDNRSLMSGVIVEVSSRTFTIPFECPCCGAAPDSELTVAPSRQGASRVADEVARGVEFPYCRACVAHASAWSDASTTASGVALLGIAAGVVVAAAARLALGLVVIGCAIPLAMAIGASRRARAKAGRGPACASPGAAVSYLGGAGGTRRFTFASPTYTARFAEQNADQLINVSAELRTLVEGHRVARLVVPTPATPVTVVSAPPTLLQWVAKLEAAPGRAARRNTLQRALEVAHDGAERRPLIAAACRLELADLLDEMDERSSLAGRRRQLEAAIAHVRADNLADELRDAVLHELEARLRALD